MSNIEPVRKVSQLVIFSVFLWTVYLFYLGILNITYVPQLVVVLFSVVLFNYTILYHKFKTNTFRYLSAGAVFVVFIFSSLYTVYRMLQTTFSEKTLIDLQSPGTISLSGEFLPESWVLFFLLPPLLLASLHALMASGRPRYVTPQTLEEIPTSPIFFSFGCMIIGLWSVLFVGINITQRIIIIAPIFEELLKFGVALLIATALFGRSMSSRIAVAIVVGTLFGLIEHSTTYASEPDILYLFRTAFHSITTVLSVSTYTLFEREGHDNLLAASLITPILLHFFNNAFSLFGGLILLLLAEGSQNIISIVFGAAVIVLGGALVLLTVLWKNAVVSIHRSIYEIV